MGESIYISRKGYEKLLLEEKQLSARRPLISKAIEEAREKGDLKENAEYHAAKEDLAHLQRRIHNLKEQISNARILEDQGDIPSDKAYIGATVQVKDDDGYESKYTLVDSAEANPTEGLISISSPIGQSLLGQGVDTRVKVPVGKDGYFLTILNISR